ncbi:MAG: hypothetical protein Q8N59_02185 [bacterium]|nr:hypothetical protein [bacterium]
MGHYLRKQIIIVVIFLLIIAAIVVGSYFIFRPKSKATCIDGIKNQGEERVDCGGPCNPCEKQREPLEIIYQKAIPTVENNFDLVVGVRNPNNNWGAKSVGYTLNIYSEQGENIVSKQGSFYIIPQEDKYIVEPKISLSDKPGKVEFKILNTSWQRLSGFRDLALRIKDKKIQTGEGVQARISGVITNNTNYDLNKAEIVGVIFGTNNEIIAAGKTEVNTLLREENRYFEINWPQRISGEVVSYEIKAYTDVFSPDNFIDVQSRNIQQ